MKRLLVFACLLALAAVAALTGALSSAHGSTAQVPSRIGGVVPVRGAQLPGAGIPLLYHGGPVMVTNKTYAIYWKPSGFSMAPGYDTTINQFFTDVAHDSGWGRTSTPRTRSTTVRGRARSPTTRRSAGP